MPRPCVLRLVPLLLLVGLPALAQSSALAGDDLSRGATLPPTNAALADEATAPLVNPAGLSQLRALQLFYLHERNVARGSVVDGLYVGETFFDAVGVGFGVEWIRTGGDPSRQRPDRRKTTWALSLGGPSFSLGSSFGFFESGESRFLDESMTVDLGILSRPTRYLSVGAVIKNVNEPTETLSPRVPQGREPQRLPRQYELALGLRPFGERFTFGVGYLLDASAAVTSGRLSYLANAEVLRGFVLNAGVSHAPRSPTGEWTLQVGATFNLSKVGVSYVAGSAPGGLNHVFVGRISGGDYPSMVGRGGSIGMIELTSALTPGDSTALALLGMSEADAYLRLTRLLDQAERDPDLAGLVVKIEALPDVGLAKAEELRQGILRLRRAGKKVVSVLLTGGDTEYLVASAADQVYLVPQSTLMVNGLSASVVFLGGSMEKLGVTWDVARVGAYKNAPDQFTRTEMSPEQRETINAYLDAEMRHLETTISQMRNIPTERVHAAMREGMVTPKRAAELGLVDGIIQPHEIDAKLKELMPRARFSGAYGFATPERVRWGRTPVVAIVPVIGSITSGKSREDPLGATRIAGAETVIRAISSAADDPNVAAIVIRVDSGGGDALSSDLMYRAVLEAKKRKPVIASMGDVAASGGYYAAMGASEVFASPTTLTGSIGIFAMKPAIQGLAHKLGARQETIKRGELSTMLNTFEPWTPEERAAAQKWVDQFYDDFITEVSTSRKLPKEQVDALARGRVWAGGTAKEVGLVDTLGTLQDAIDAARRAAGLRPDQPSEIAVIGEPGSLLGEVASSPLAWESLRRIDAPAATRLPEPTRTLINELGLPSSVLLEPGVKAMMPFHLELH